MHMSNAQNVLLTGFDSLAMMQADWYKSTNDLGYIDNAATESLHKKEWARPN
jgi:aryl carrier-like protein